MSEKTDSANVIRQLMAAYPGINLRNPVVSHRAMTALARRLGAEETACRTSPTKCVRRTKDDIDHLRDEFWIIIAENKPVTVRQVFYQAVSRGFIQKAESEYKSTVCRLLTEMRLKGELPFGWIADNTRWMRKPRSFSSIEMAIKRTAEAYRRSIWDNQQVYVEIWLEKDALSGVLYEVTAPWDVPLMVTRGYPSVSYLHEAAEAISEQGKPAYLYYLGDFDPSGVDIPRNIEARLREFTPESEINFERIAVNKEQIEEFDLPTRPTKKSDTRSRNFDGESVEVDAIPPKALRELVGECIMQHIDQDALDVMRVAEKSEQQVLEVLASLSEPEMREALDQRKRAEP
jgi:hypothetical protein